MTWYLVLRAFCILSFIMAFSSLFGAAFAMDDHKPVAARRWILYGFLFAIAGCFLVGAGWTGEHP